MIVASKVAAAVVSLVPTIRSGYGVAMVLISTILSSTLAARVYRETRLLKVSPAAILPSLSLQFGAATNETTAMHGLESNMSVSDDAE